MEPIRRMAAFGSSSWRGHFDGEHAQRRPPWVFLAGAQ